MSALLALALVQVAAEPPQRWSVLTGDDGICRPSTTDENEVVVCAARNGDRIPLPDERVPIQRQRAAVGDSRAGLDALGTPCAATQWGCQVGFGPSLPQIIGGAKAVGRVVGSLFKGKPDRSERVPILLDDPVMRR